MRNALGSLLLTSTLVSAAGGCMVEASGHVAAPVAVVEVEEAPPPPRPRVVIETRPGYVFIDGRWARRGNHWDWVDGYWERERTGHVWVAGRWERRGNRHVWIDGSWRATTVVRDHR